MNGNKRKSLTITGAGDILMNLEFKPEVLSKEYVKEHGVPYDDGVFYQDDYHIGALYDRLPELGGTPFTGLLYELYNDKLIYYQFFTDGYGVELSRNVQSENTQNLR